MPQEKEFQPELSQQQKILKKIKNFAEEKPVKNKNGTKKCRRTFLHNCRSISMFISRALTDRTRQKYFVVTSNSEIIVPNMRELIGSNIKIGNLIEGVLFF